MTPSSSADPSPSGAGDRLTGWKEIASFLDRGVRTVQRWETTLGLPVHRLRHERGEVVFAFRPELEAWLREASARRAMAETSKAAHDSHSDGPDSWTRAPATAAGLRHDRGTAGRKRHVLGLASGAALALAVAGAAWWWWRQPATLTVGVPRQLTATVAWETETAISPDGNTVAYVSDQGGDVDIWVVDARGGEPVRVTRDPVRERRPRWFPDGNALVFVSAAGGTPNVWKVSREGGAPTLLVTNADDPAISPDGSHVAFVRTGDDGELRVFVASLAGPAGALELTSSRDGLWSHHQPAWSPDGSLLCYAAQRDLWIVPAAGGRAHRLTTDGEYDRDPTWSPDGRFVYFSSFREGSFALWRVSAGGGVPTRLTLGTGPERFPTVSRDGSHLAYATYSENSNIVVHELASGTEHEFGGLRDEHSPVLSPDGKAVVYASDQTAGEIGLWYQQLADHGEPVGPPRRIAEATAAQPSYSPDGHWIAFHRVVNGQRDIWTVRVAGGTPIQVTDHPAVDIHPDWSPDGRAIVFASDRGGTQNLWIAPVEDGRPAGPARQLTSGRRTEVAPAWSPDGARIAFVVLNDRGGSEVWTVGADGALARPLTTGASAQRVAWEPSGRTLLVSGYWNTDQISIRRVDGTVTGARASEPLAWLGTNPEIIDFELSRDGRLFTFARPNARGDVWVVDARPGAY